jgi:hypothetical protein
VSASQPITRPRSAADKLGLAPTTLTGPQLITIAAGDSVTWSSDDGSPPVVVFWSDSPGLEQKRDPLRAELVHPRSQIVQDCTGSFLTSARVAFPPAAAPFPDPIQKGRLLGVPDVIRPNLVKAIEPVPCRRSAQAVLWSAKKLSGGSASSGVNRGSKRNRVPQ